MGKKLALKLYLHMSDITIKMVGDNKTNHVTVSYKATVITMILLQIISKQQTYQKLLNEENPAPRRGRLTASPSGKF